VVAAIHLVSESGKHIGDRLFIGKDEWAIEKWRVAKAVKSVAFRIDQQQLQSCGRVGQNESGECGSEPFALAAAGRACDQQVCVLGACEVDHPQSAVDIDSERDERRAFERFGIRELPADG